MVNSMVDRATSDMLIGPDWAMNIEICDICNRDVAQAKDVVKGIKKRLQSKNPKVQLLALTLLETIVKNCGDIVHMHVAEKNLLHEMVKIVKKKPDFHVKEKILILIDTWQEAFGGARARYTQYFAAYQELLRIGAVFPQRSESSAPVFTPPQTHPLSSYPQNLRNSESLEEAAESSAEPEFPTLSSTEIQNARGIMDVLAEMLNALDPRNKEGLRQEVIVDLVEQCRTYKQRVVHLVNSTSDEALLRQGLALNDDLQRVLAKHEAIASGTHIPIEKSKPEPVRDLVDVDAPLIDAGDKQLDKGSTSGSGGETLLLLPAPPATNGPSTTPQANTKFDLLSGDDFSSPTADNPLALVPVGDAQPTSPVSQQNALALVDMFPQTNNAPPVNQLGQTYPSMPLFQQQPQQNFQTHPNGSVHNTVLSQYEQPPYAQGNPAWNAQITQQQQPPSPVYGGSQSGSSLPPPPWELQQTETNQLAAPQYPQQMQTPNTSFQQLPAGSFPQGSQPMGNNQVAGMYLQNQQVGFQHPQSMQGGPMMGMGMGMGMFQQPMQSGQMGMGMGMGMYPQQQMYGNQMAAAYGYGYGQQQNTQFLDHRMSGLSVRDDSVLQNSSYPISPSSYVPPGKPSKPEDKLFGDLVDISKFKPTKTTSGRAGSL